MSNQQVQKVKVKRLAQIGLWATDVITQAKFYQQILGMDVHVAGGEAQDIDLEDANLYLALGEGHNCLGLFNDTRPASNGGRKPLQRTLVHHLTFEMDTNAELAALAARLNQAGIEFRLEPREDDADGGTSLWLNDPDDNQLEISVASERLLSTSTSGRLTEFRPYSLQHLALYTPHLETMVEFYTEALGFDISDWLLRERAWLRCNNNHHSIMLIQGNAGIDHIGYHIRDGAELLRWADHLSQQQVPLIWGPGRHGASNDLFLRIADPESIHIELSAEMQQYYDRDVTAPPRLWHTRATALNLWGGLPSWIREEAQA